MRYVFAVAEDTYCCWDQELPQHNASFLATLDGDYFTYLANVHLSELEGENRQRAAVSLRTAYHHGVETLFSLLGAMAQAPDAVPAWLPRCLTPNLREVVQCLSSGRPLLTQRGRQSLRFEDLAAITHQYCWVTETPPNSTASRFATLWRRLAHELLDERNVFEYNSIKHGFRVGAGGFTLRIGEEVEYGVRAPEANMHTVGSSPFGTRFFVPLPLRSDGESKFHFILKHSSLNWRAEAMAQRLQLIAFSIKNVVGCLRCMVGAPPDTIQFFRPEDPQAFEAAWQWSVGMFASDFSSTFAADEIVFDSRAALLSELEARAE